MNGTSAASSLYSGIFGPASSSDAQQQGDSTADAAGTSDNGALTPEAGNGTASGSSTSTASKPQAWSAALRFAPRRSQNAPKVKKPIALSIPLSAEAGLNANGTLDKRVTAGDASSSATVDVAGVTAKTASPFVKVAAREGAFARDEAGPSAPAIRSTSTRCSPKATSPNPRPLRAASNTCDLGRLPGVLEPPELSLPAEELEADRALFSALAEQRGERPVTQQPHQHRIEDVSDDDVNGFAATAEGQKARKKKRRRHNLPGRYGGLSASLNMDADYDVGIPNDYNDFKSLIRSRREAVKRRREEMEAINQDWDDASEDGSEEDGEAAEKQRKYRRFAPPSTYKGAERRSSTVITMPDSDDDKPYISLTPPPEKPSLSVPPAPGPPPRPPLSHSVDASTSSIAAAGSGEEAYLRRVALSQATSGDDSYEQQLRLSESSSTPPIDTRKDVPTQSEETQKPPDASDFAARAAAAAAIAARLSRAKPSAPAQSDISESRTPTHIDPSTFAERLMTKQGWKRGEALGAEGNKGMLDPLLAEKVERERRKQRDGSSTAGSHISTGPRGNIVNAQEEAKRRQERSKYGEPSEVILLENMIAGDHEIDDDLPTEIGDECAKHGYVERVFIWSARKAAEHGNIGLGPRIFVRFSGMAGAWRCLKELDGRYFGGRTVSARYYPPADFAQGHYGRRWTSI